jgi:hypothetical protein
VIDGRVDDGEWRDALSIEHPPGTVVRLQRDADHLYVGITSLREGYASVCVAVDSAVHVLHASAALGQVTYRRTGDTWRSADTAFRYGMRNTAVDDAARAQRTAYLRVHGWVASTVSMGDNGHSQEIQIAFGSFPMPLSLAISRWLFTNQVESWPATIADHEGCLSRQLVQGYVPQGLQFRPADWLAVESSEVRRPAFGTSRPPGR